MYDTKTRELRWNATYFDYAASLPEDDGEYSKCSRVALQGWLGTCDWWEASTPKRWNFF